jgi:hypothetical protein
VWSSALLRHGASLFRVNAQIDVVAGTHVRDLGPGVLQAPVSVAASLRYIAVAARDGRVADDDSDPTQYRAVHLFSVSTRDLVRVLGTPGQLTETRGLRFNRPQTAVVATNPRRSLVVLPVEEDPLARPTAMMLPPGVGSPADVQECEDGWLVAVVVGTGLVYLRTPCEPPPRGSQGTLLEPEGQRSGVDQCDAPHAVRVHPGHLFGYASVSGLVHICGLGLLVRHSNECKVQVSAA